MSLIVDMPFDIYVRTALSVAWLDASFVRLIPGWNIYDHCDGKVSEIQWRHLSVNPPKNDADTATNTKSTPRAGKQSGTLDKAAKKSTARQKWSLYAGVENKADIAWKIGADTAAKHEADNATETEADRAAENETDNTAEIETNNTTENETNNTTENETNNATENETNNTTENETNNTTENETNNATENETNNTAENETNNATEYDRERSPRHADQQRMKTKPTIRRNQKCLLTPKNYRYTLYRFSQLWTSNFWRRIGLRHYFFFVSS